MERVEKTVFISYRRTNIPWALAIYQNLTQNGFDVFFDYNGIASGDFERVILENIHARAHFLVLLTPSALERCGDPQDWLRREIEAALDSRRNVVPLMLEGFDFGTPAIASQLTGRLAGLKQYNALNIPADYFLEAMGRLRDRYLNVPLDAVLHPASFVARQAATQQKAAAEVAPAVAEEELTAQQWFERGFEALDLDQQIRFYTEAIRLNPDYAVAYYNRGISRHDQGDVDGAIQDYNQVIRLRPDDADSFINRGVARVDQNDLEGAVHDYVTALRFRPDDAEAFNNRGLARIQLGDQDGALQDYDEAIRIKPDFASAFFNRAIARHDQGDLEGALQDYDEAIRLTPEDADAFNNRGAARHDKGELEGALQDFNEAIRLKPDDGEAFYNRSLVRRAKGDVEGATQDYNEAMRFGYKPED